MNYIVHYIVCFYLGRRKSKKFNSIIDQDSLYFLKKHLDFLQNCGPEVTEATFVVNGDVPEQFVKYAHDNAPKNVKINVVGRTNHGFSYGAWNDVIVNNLKKGNRHNYYFMIEDDYIPTKPDFYKPFIAKCNSETPFVCCKTLASPLDNTIHPAISNGVIYGPTCEFMLMKCNNIFNVPNTNLITNSYDVAYLIQTYYLTHFVQEGFKFTDISDDYCFPFHESEHDTHMIHGKPDGEKLILPLL